MTLEHKVVLVKRNGIPYSIGSGRYCFLLEDGEPVKEVSQRVGARVSGQEYLFNEAFSLACFAWESQIFDGVEEWNGS